MEGKGGNTKTLIGTLMLRREKREGELKGRKQMKQKKESLRIKR